MGLEKAEYGADMTIVQENFNECNFTLTFNSAIEYLITKSFLEHILSEETTEKTEIKTLE